MGRPEAPGSTIFKTGASQEMPKGTKGCTEIGMRHYRIDELRYQDYEKIKQHLDETCGPCQVEGVYWVALDNDQLGEVQSAHKGCQPFYFAIELNPNAISFELLVRTRKRMRCDCIQYADADQREHIIRFADHLFEHLKLMS